MKYFSIVIVSALSIINSATAASEPVPGKVISRESTMTTPLEVRQKNEFLRTGTGFFVEYPLGGEIALFLVTNVHVLAGEDYSKGLTDKPVGDSVALVCRNAQLQPVAFYATPILDKNGKRLWEESRAYASKIPDVAALPLPSEYKKKCSGLHVLTLDTLAPKVPLLAGAQVFEVGYPEMLMDASNYFPVWKSGTVASEPEADFQGQPVVLVDLTGFPGSSGSPVLQVYRAIQTPVWSIGMGETPSTLVGVNSASTRAGLSYVWKASVVKDILASYASRNSKTSLKPMAR